MAKEKAKRFTDLIVWQKAHKYVLAVYRFTASFPKQEVYGLTSQLRRASISIAANIAEGFKKSGKADKVRFLNISQGSLEECRYYLILAKDLAYDNTDVLQEQIDEVARVLAAYSKAVKNSAIKM